VNFLKGRVFAPGLRILGHPCKLLVEACLKAVAVVRGFPPSSISGGRALTCDYGLATQVLWIRRVRED
jgi:hypothetical protein